MESDISPERVREVFNYDPDTGSLTWKIRTSIRVTVGSVAGTINKVSGHRCLGLDGTKTYAHRVVWCFVHGEWPTTGIDHRNGIKDDNRISNLRLATQPENNQNFHQMNRKNTSGFTGVSRHKDGIRWKAFISHHNRTKSLGSYATAEEAHAAYTSAKRKLHPFWEGQQAA